MSGQVPGNFLEIYRKIPVEIYVKDGQSFTRDDLDLLVKINPDNKTFENEKVRITVL